MPVAAASFANGWKYCASFPISGSGAPQLLDITFAREAAATGITVMAASGDQGSAGYDSSVPRSVMWPSNDPYVLGD